MPPALMAASVAAPIIGSGIGALASRGDQERADKARQEALNQILNLQLPTVESQELALEKQKIAGVLAPEMEGTVQQDQSAMAGISTDPRLRQAQMNALSSLTDLGTTGLTSADRAALLNIRNQTEGDAQAASASIMQNMAQRGMSGGGAELAARLAAAQGATNRGAQAGMDLAAQAQQKALQAMSSAGALGSQIEGQQFGQDAQKASAADAIARFNAANRQNVMGTNVGAKNAAQQYNISNAQNVANANTDIANKQQVNNKGLLQQDYQNRFGKATAASGQYDKQSAYDTQQADKTREIFGKIGQGVGGGLAAGGQAMTQSSNLEKILAAKGK
jgi:hypothetical protein